MTPRVYGEVAYTLTDLQIASYTPSTDTYGTAASLQDGQTLEMKPQSDNDQMRGYGVIKRLLAIPTHVEFKISQGGVEFAVLSIATGIATISSSSTPTRTQRLKLTGGGEGLPYIGIVGKAAAEGGGDLWVGIPKAKLNGYPATMFDGNKNAYFMSEMEGKGAANDNGLLVVLFAHETATAIDFNTVFS